MPRPSYSSKGTGLKKPQTAYWRFVRDERKRLRRSLSDKVSAAQRDHNSKASINRQASYWGTRANVRYIASKWRNLDMPTRSLYEVAAYEKKQTYERRASETINPEQVTSDVLRMPANTVEPFCIREVSTSLLDSTTMTTIPDTHKSNGKSYNEILSASFVNADNNYGDKLLSQSEVKEEIRSLSTEHDFLAQQRINLSLRQDWSITGDSGICELFLCLMEHLDDAENTI